MSIKIRNPNFVDTVTTWVTANKAAIQQFFVDHAATEVLTGDAIRAALPALADKLTDGTIAEIARTLDIEVLPE
jgi:hypothetical protein